MVTVPLSINFTLREFENVSSIPWTLEAQVNADRFVSSILQPLRRAMGFPVCVTEYGAARARGGRGHPTFEAVDIAPCDSNADKMERMFQWIATYTPGEFGELIHERDHVHLTLPGVGGDGDVLREPIEGEVILGGVAQALIPASAAIVVGYLFGIIGKA